MKEELVSFQTAKLAKERGFDISTDKYWCNYYTGEPLNKWKLLPAKELSLNFMEYAAPTQYLLQKWLREVHEIDVIALPTSSSKYIFRLYQKGKTCKNQIYGDYMSKEYANYEEAFEYALVYGLNKIKI